MLRWVGLGNWNVTPDALGPIAVENLLITRHLFELAPEQVQDGFRRHEKKLNDQMRYLSFFIQALIM